MNTPGIDANVSPSGFIRDTTQLAMLELVALKLTR
jgi:hypothetical protein